MLCLSPNKYKGTSPKYHHRECSFAERFTIARLESVRMIVTLGRGVDYL